MSINSTLKGRLTADPELRFTPSGKAIAKFTVVTSKSKKDDAGKWVDEDTTFWSCTAWDLEAEAIANTLTKGDSVVVIGDISQRTWEDPKTGEKRSRMEVLARTVAAVISRSTTVKIERVQRTAAQTAAADDPWAANDPWATPTQPDTPPF